MQEGKYTKRRSSGDEASNHAAAPGTGIEDGTKDVVIVNKAAADGIADGKPAKMDTTLGEPFISKEDATSSGYRSEHGKSFQGIRYKQFCFVYLSQLWDVSGVIRKQCGAF